MTSETGTIDRLVAEVTDCLARRGVHAVLGFLNARTRYRFTGIYRFDPPVLRNICLFDRENPDLVLGGETPMRETYCSLVGASASPFATRDAADDPRLTAHPARTSVIAYCGVPLITADGTCVGTLCHFDLRPRLVPETELPLLLSLAPLLLKACQARGEFMRRG